VRSALELPNDREPQAIITLGWPDEERTSTRKPLQEVVVWR
jgi:nitroreductase